MLVYSEKATTFCQISPLLLSTVHTVKSKVEISQNVVAFSEYTNPSFMKPIRHFIYLTPYLSLQYLCFCFCIVFWPIVCKRAKRDVWGCCGGRGGCGGCGDLFGGLFGLGLGFGGLRFNKRAIFSSKSLYHSFL